jgi:hypothetical protein
VKNYPQLVQDDHQTENDEMEIQNDHVTQETETSIEEHIQEGLYVAAIYDNIVYMGKVLERDDPEKEMSISFMQKDKLEGYYRWPQTEDTVWIEFAKVLCRVDDHIPTGRSMTVCAFKSEDIAETERRFVLIYVLEANYVLNI